ncbi:MAG: sialate O-acetylesterase [bacterium]|nr:sialate O-acetylesterase [bacterium]
MRHLLRVFGPGLLAAFFTPPLPAAPRLPAIWNHNMLLQRDQRLPIWGWARPGEEITVQFGGQLVMTIADDTGSWRTTIGPFMANDEPWELVISGARTKRVLTNVLVGDVWLCSGQSNMEWPVHSALHPNVEIPAATNPLIRLATVHHATAPEPAANARVTWQVCSPANVTNFSAVAYFFARELQPHLRVPIAVINASWGATPIEAWISRDALEAIPFMSSQLAQNDEALRNYCPTHALRKYREQLAAWSNAVRTAQTQGSSPPPPPKLSNPFTDPSRPATLFNAMIHPLIPFALRGFLWYQGESNANNAKAYRILFPALILDWRARWGRATLPFIYVQLANFLAPQTTPVETHATWPFLREAQTLALRIPHTAMACAIDLADPDNPNDIHPKNKQVVAHRLVCAARHIAYGEDLVFSGPLFRKAEFTNAHVVLHFDHTGSGLVSREGPLRGFALAGANKKFVWADALITGLTVLVSATNVPSPLAVRYGWANNPIGNLYNVEGFPAVPFRTDNWE